MNRFKYTEFIQLERERLLTKENLVHIYDGNVKTSFENGEVMLTNFRILWGRPGEIVKGFQCLMLPLHFVVYIEEESPSTFSFSKSKKVILHLTEATKDDTPRPASYSKYNHIKLSFKEGLTNNFLSHLHEALQSREWEIMSTTRTTSPSVPNIKLRTGIIGIERSIQEKQLATDASISAAFQDLDKLMTMAKEMVQLSQAISSKIKEKQGDITEDETVKFKSYLMGLGIDDPVTRDAFKSENQFYKSLSKEISEILVSPITEVGGLMTLTDAYCRVNRARGLELISPEDFFNACKLFESMASPLRLHMFSTGVRVLQLNSLSDEAIAEATLDLILEKESLTPEELARHLGISVMLAKIRLLTTEKLGKACRDESIEGLRFYLNRFLLEE